jgi:DNA-binding GntR family transcriptional regulator
MARCTAALAGTVAGMAQETGCKNRMTDTLDVISSDAPDSPDAADASAEVRGLGRLQPRTLVHQVIDALVAAAAEGVILPGDRIVEVDIAQRLGVSRVPVREALRVLESQGVVVNEPYKGIRLTPVTHERIDQLIEVRVALETTAMRAAIRQGRNRGAPLLRLKAIVDDMVARASVNDVAGFAEADTRFHRTLCALSGNLVLADMWEMLARQMTIIFGLSALGKPMVDIVDEHRVLLRVFEGGNLDEVASTLHDHIDVEIHKVDLEGIVERRRSMAMASA